MGAWHPLPPVGHHERSSHPPVAVDVLGCTLPSPLAVMRGGGLRSLRVWINSDPTAAPTWAMPPPWPGLVLQFLFLRPVHCLRSTPTTTSRPPGLTSIPDLVSVPGGPAQPYLHSCRPATLTRAPSSNSPSPSASCSNQSNLHTSSSIPAGYGTVLGFQLFQPCRCSSPCSTTALSPSNSHTQLSRSPPSDALHSDSNSPQDDRDFLSTTFHLHHFTTSHPSTCNRRIFPDRASTRGPPPGAIIRYKSSQSPRSRSSS